MRQIIFRGKRRHKNEWVFGHLYKDKGELVINNYEVIPESIGQNTMLFDKSGKYVFEGDFCREDAFVFICKYIPEWGGFHWMTPAEIEIYENEGEEGFEDVYLMTCNKTDCLRSTISGNTFDKPSVLKEHQ